MEATTAEGLRERKKRKTREVIAAAALSLFQARGYDEVTVADVARAAEVSEKTVFNYFPNKEDLVFSRGTERLAARIEAIRSRPEGTPLLDVFRADTMTFLDRVQSGHVEQLVAIPRLVMGSSTLRERLFLDWEREASLIVTAVAGEDPDDLWPAVVVHALTWTHRLVVRTAIGRVLAGEDPADVAAGLRDQARLAYARLDGGIARYGS